MTLQSHLQDTDISQGQHCWEVSLCNEVILNGVQHSHEISQFYELLSSGETETLWKAVYDEHLIIQAFFWIRQILFYQYRHFIDGGA